MIRDNMSIMNNKTYFNFQIVGMVLLLIIVVIQVLLFFNVSDRMTAIEQKQAVFDRHMNVLWESQINIQSVVSQ